MKKVDVTEENAKSAYNGADEKGKQLLKELFKGKVNFDEKITDRVKTFQDACAIIKPHKDRMPHAYDSKDEAAYKKLKIIVEALNEGWKPNMKDSNQRKYWPYFNIENGFSFDDVHCNSSNAIVGSRLYLKSDEFARYAGQHFIEIYEEYHTA